MNSKQTRVDEKREENIFFKKCEKETKKNGY